jgi:hypothetical protein
MDKPLKVINSCISQQQLTVAEKYLNFWKQNHPDQDYTVLDRALLGKKMKLKTWME